MAERAGTLELVAAELGRVLAPLEERLRGGEVLGLLEELGFRFPPELTEQTELVQALEDTATAAGKLPGLVTQLVAAVEQEDLTKLTQLGEQLLTLVKQVIGGFDTISAKLKAAAGALASIPPARITGFATELPGRLLDYLLVSYLEADHRVLLNFLTLLGVVELRQEAGDPMDPTKPPYLHKQLHLDQFGELLRAPEHVLESLYGWGQPVLRADLLLERLGDVLTSLNVPAAVDPGGAGAPPVLRVLLFDLRPTTGVTPPGLDATLQFALTDGLTIEIPLTADGWSMALAAKGTLTGGVGVRVTPPANLSLAPPAGTVSGEVSLGVTGAPPDPAQPFLLLGQAGATRLEAGSVGVRAGAGFALDVATGKAVGEVLLEARIAKGHVVVSFGGADSFLASIIPADGLEGAFDLTAGWSGSRGVYFEGSGGIEVNLGLHVTLGPFLVETLHLRLGVGADGLEVETSVSGSGSLGPLVAAVERIGALARLRFERGNLGPADLSLQFRSPDGLGMALDAGPITGGGFLAIDQANHRYAGILQLRAGVLSITAIGLLDTRLPGGAPGFSFLIIVTAKFSPIQLGFGFTLNGLGGLAGINRTIVVEALQAGVRSHSLDGLLFPEDPVRDAPQIISDLRAIFPPVPGRYVFGPMALLGYGTPTLLEAELGIILELPAPLRIVLIGQLNAALPERKAPVVELHLDVLGVLDFGARTLSIDASLHDSRIAAFDVFGDMAMRLSWGDEPNFVLSVGGFHPAFRAPPDFPQLRRLTLALGSGENPRLTLQTYLAVTSNTFQIGARAELYAEAAGFNLQGWIGFDALFVFSPFSFQTDFSAGFALRRGSTVIAGIHLDATLTGTTPFHAWGEASLSILFFEITVGFDKSFGEEQRVELAPGDPWAALKAAAEDRRNWSATLPPAVFQVVSVTTPTGAGDEPVLVDPMGGLTLRQKAVPLDRTLTRFGEAPLAFPHRFAPVLDQVQVGVGAVPRPGLVQDAFAPAQFEELSDADKLSRPSFEQMDTGLTLASERVECTLGGGVRGLDATYETVTIDAPKRPPTPVPGGPWTLSSAQQLSVLDRAAAARSALLRTGLERFAPPPDAEPLARLDEEAFLVVGTEDLAPRPDVLKEPTTKGAAFQALDAWLAGRPEDRGALQVVPVHELETVA
jgi:hypothetical protein